MARTGKGQEGQGHRADRVLKGRGTTALPRSLTKENILLDPDSHGGNRDLFSCHHVRKIPDLDPLQGLVLGISRERPSEKVRQHSDNICVCGTELDGAREANSLLRRG